jgi:2-dehydro-3-deoxyphosphogluconate aldolase / (4S)-4-hydroxy-2-oxoglutarate aldolase
VSTAIASTRTSDVAEAIRIARLVVVLRGITPQSRLIDLVGDLHEAGARIFEITFDAPDAATDVTAVAQLLAAAASHDKGWVGAGTVRTIEQLRRAREASAAFSVSPVFDPEIVGAAAIGGHPIIPGAYTPTEIDTAWRAGATFVKVFPASSLGPNHIREIGGPMPEVELIATGGIDASNAVEFLRAGAVAVGIGSALVKADRDGRRRLVEMIAAAPRA